DAAGLMQGQEGHWMVFVDGRFEAGLSRIGGLPAGARVASVAQVLADEAGRLEAVLGQAEEGGSPAALNLAFAADGAYVELPPGTSLEEPLHVVHIAAGAGVASFPRSVVLLGRGARATLIEHFVGQAQSPTLTNTVLRGRLE